MGTVTIFHNPRCSKSRSSLAILNEQGLEPEIRLYLENPPSAEELTSILAMLKISARDLLRKGEPDYKALNMADPDVSETEIIQPMPEHPKLIERPIVIQDGKAAIGRPPDIILEDSFRRLIIELNSVKNFG